MIKLRNGTNLVASHKSEEIINIMNASNPLSTGPIPVDYIERVYAGVLGKIIGVYLGRPFEGWSYEKIRSEFGQIDYYVHERLGVPLIVSDDDISGTFTFLRALEDHGPTSDISSKQIGQTWLNYIIENKTILWWGGIGQSTEHTAFLNLKNGIDAPDSGSIETNGSTVAEQIGAQIFIDGWGLVAPGNPDLAVKLAGEAACVSHDGEAVYAALVIAAMVSMAFVEPDIDKLLDCATSYIPSESIVSTMIADIREWSSVDFDWRVTRQKLEELFGYHKFPGNCHVVPNHGVIILALLHGKGDFSESLRIANSCGWDTDCNSANVGCVLGVRNGLVGFETGPDWRGPVADRLFLPTADGGRCITDAVRESYAVAAMGHKLTGSTLAGPKDGARFHFSLSGSVQGFVSEQLVESRGVVTRIFNTSEIEPDSRTLRADFRYLSSGRFARIKTATFASPEKLQMEGYGLQMCPTLYPGQTVHARVRVAANSAVELRLYLRQYNHLDTLTHLFAPSLTVENTEWNSLSWRVPEEGGYPIAEIGVEVSCDGRADGFIEIDTLDWSGAPDVTLARTEGGDVWQRAWVDAVDEFSVIGNSSTFQVIQNRDEIGLIAQGTSEWESYTATALITPWIVRRCGLIVGCRGLTRYFAFVFAKNEVQLIQCWDSEIVLGREPFVWNQDQCYQFNVTIFGNHIFCSMDGVELLNCIVDVGSSISGMVGYFVERGRITTEGIIITPFNVETESIEMEVIE